MSEILIKLKRLLNKQSKNITWIIFNFLDYRNYIHKNYSIHNIKPYNWYNWHNSAKCFTGIIIQTNTPVFLKTDSIHNTLNNEYKMTVLFYNALSESCPKPLDYISFNKSDTIIFEKINGHTLAQIIHKEELYSKINWDIFSAKLINIVEILSKLKMIHRDLTPYNIMIKTYKKSNSLDLFIIDFAFAGLINKKINDEYIDDTELSHLGLTFKPREYTWDDAYSAFKIFEYIEKSININLHKFKDSLSKRIGRLSYIHTPN